MSTVSPGPTVTPLFPYPLPYRRPSCRFLCGTWWVCRSTRRGHTWRQRADSLVTTEQPLSVIPPYLRHQLDLDVLPVSGWSGAIPDWRGIPCQIGRVQACLPIMGSFLPRQFSTLVLLPRREPPDPLPYAYLGVQFLIEYQAQVELDCSTGAPHSCSGQLLIP